VRQLAAAFLPAGFLAGISTESTKNSQQAGYGKAAASCRTPRLCRPALWAQIGVLFWGLAIAAPAWTAPPNIVLITIDTVRADHLGCYGYPQGHTPNLDSLAREGILFRTVVSSVPLTFPSHCSILTGTYPTVHGVRDNLGYTLGDSPPTLATLLKQKGYSTAAFVGAAVLGSRRGLNRGFDTYSSPFERKMGRDNPLVLNLQDLRRRAEDVVADALRWMNAQPAHTSRPFFVWIHLYDPHTPYDPPPRFRALAPKPYDSEIAYADYAMGKFLDYLKEHSLYDSSLIVAASDHGESFGEHDEYTHGYFIYDATLLVPLIIKPPRTSGLAPRRIGQPVRTIDIAPTVLQFLGIPASPSMQGNGLLSLILGKTTSSATSPAYAESFYPTQFGSSGLRALRTGRYKYIDAPKPELYDLLADPQEIQNLYSTQRSTALELKGQFETLVARITPKGPPRRAVASPGDVEELASLGYVGNSSAPVPGAPGPSLPDPKDGLKTYKILNLSTQMASEGKCAGAIPLLTRLVQEQPDAFLGQVTLAKCDLFLGKYQAADSALDSALRIHPDNLEAKFYQGISQFQEGRFSEALASLQPLAKAHPNEPYLHFYLGSIYEKEGATEQALGEYQKCAAIDPTFEVAVYKVGYFLAKSGKFSDAAVQFKKVAEMDPPNAQAHFNLALAYQKSGNEAAARPEFETACKLDPAKCLPPDQQ
jgi:arylsulfatase A-like enzyme/Flp pilus assembly protein TadD